MIQATYDKNTKSAPATGAVQYDAGQEIYLYGLPESLSGTLEMQFAYAGDAKAEGRMAEYDAAKKAWKARVPNKYLTRARAVNVYLYQTLDQETAGTIYTAVFTPLGRSAPGGEVTPDEISQWGELVGQFTAKMAEMDAAIGHANEAAANVRIELEKFEDTKINWEARLQSAEETAQSANSAAQEAKRTAASASETAQSAEQTANGASEAANSAANAAENAQLTANEANEKATGAHYWAAGPVNVSVGTSGWTQDAANDRYYKDFTVSGMTADMMPFASSSKVGGKFPLCGCESMAGKIRLYMTDTPEISSTVTVYGMKVRA